MERKVCSHVAAHVEQTGANLAHIEAENLQNTCSKHACLTLLDREHCQEEVGGKAIRQN